MPLILISPAKTMNFEGLRQVAAPKATTPVFHKVAAALCRQLGAQTSESVCRLLGVSANLAKVNTQRYKSFQSAVHSKPVAGSLEYGRNMLACAVMYPLIPSPASIIHTHTHTHTRTCLRMLREIY